MVLHRYDFEEPLLQPGDMIAWKKAFSLVFHTSLMRVLISRVIVSWEFLSSPHVTSRRDLKVHRQRGLPHCRSRALDQRAFPNTWN